MFILHPIKKVKFFYKLKLRLFLTVKKFSIATDGRYKIGKFMNLSKQEKTESDCWKSSRRASLSVLQNCNNIERKIMKTPEFSHHLNSIAYGVDEEADLTALGYTYGFLTALHLIIANKIENIQAAGTDTKKGGGLQKFLDDLKSPQNSERANDPNGKCEHSFELVENYQEMGKCKDTGLSFACLGEMICKKCKEPLKLSPLTGRK